MVHEVAALFKGFPQQPMRTFRALYAGVPHSSCCLGAPLSANLLSGADWGQSG